MSHPGISIRKAQAGDIPAIIELCQHSIRKTCTHDYTPLQIDAWCHSVADPANWGLAINSEFFIVAEKGEKLLGFASIKYGEYIVYLYVSPSHQRKGVATRLFENLMMEAHRLDQEYIWSNVSKTAQPFFRQLGFMIECERINYLGDVEIRNHRMTMYPHQTLFHRLAKKSPFPHRHEYTQAPAKDRFTPHWSGRP